MSEPHPIETFWREVGLPEFFLGNGGTNHKLYALYDKILASASSPDPMIRQRHAQLEGLIIGLEQRGEISAAHLIRTVLLPTP